MEYKKKIVRQYIKSISNFRTKYWVEINDVYNTNNQIKFRTTMLNPSLCDYNNAYIIVKGTITVNDTAAADANANNVNKKK